MHGAGVDAWGRDECSGMGCRRSGCRRSGCSGMGCGRSGCGTSGCGRSGCGRSGCSGTDARRGDARHIELRFEEAPGRTGLKEPFRIGSGFGTGWETWKWNGRGNGNRLDAAGRESATRSATGGTERSGGRTQQRVGTERSGRRDETDGTEGWENTGIAAKLRCGSERGARDGGVFRLTERNGTGTGTARTAPGSAPSPAAAPAALRSSAVPSLGSREGIPARLFLDGPHGTGCGEGILGGKGGGSGRYLRNRARVGGRAEPPERSWR